MTRRIDESTEVPLDLYEDLLAAGLRARLRGQHGFETCSKKGEGKLRLFEHITPHEEKCSEKGEGKLRLFERITPQENGSKGREGKLRLYESITHKRNGVAH